MRRQFFGVRIRLERWRLIKGCLVNKMNWKRMKTFVKNEISGWKIWEIVWLVSACSVILALSVYSGDTILGIVSATTGVANVVCTGKGKLSAFFFGLINASMYAWISFQAGLYGETMLNVLYYIPMQFVGFHVWRNHMDETGNEVEKRRLTGIGRLLLGGLTLVVTCLYGVTLRRLGDAMPYVDSFTTVSSAIALILSVRRLSEQWWIWGFVDVVSVYMWWCDFSTGSGNMATLLMWIVFSISAFIMIVKWERESE